MIAMNENYMSTNRLEAFYDAIIAIIVTVLVLELPQPATASIQSILALKTSYFAYLISFLVCTNLWQYHHIIYNHVERINAKIIWQNIPFSLLAEVLYGSDFIIVNIILFWMAKSLLDINPDREYLSEALAVKSALVVPFILFIIGLVIAFLGYPFAISICCLISIIRSIIYSLKN